MEKTIFGVWRRTEWEWWMTLTVWLLNLNFSDRNDAEVQMQISKFEKREVERGAAGRVNAQTSRLPRAWCVTRSLLSGHKTRSLSVVTSSNPCPVTPAPDTGHGHTQILTDPGLCLWIAVCMSMWGLGMGEDENEGEFVIQTEEEPNESPPLLPRRFLWPLVAGLQVPWSVVSIDGGQQLTSGEWGAWHPPPGWCQTSTTSHWLHWAALISTCKWYWEQHFSFRKITGNVE